MSWETVALSDVCVIRPPKSELKNSHSMNQKVSFLGMEHLGINQKNVEALNSNLLSEVYSGYTYFANNDVLLAKITPCFENGKLGIARNLINGIGFGSSEFFVFRTNNKIGSEYLYYFLSQKIFINEGKQHMTGAVGHKRVSKEFIENYKIPLPPIHIQQKIVTKLDAIFTEIDKATAAAEANIKNAEALFQSYLTEVFERGGEGFFKTTIGESCILRSGTTVNADLEQKEGDLPYLKVADMNLLANQECIVTSSRFLNFKIVNKNSVIKKGSTIFPKRGGAIDTNKKRIVDVDITVDLNIMSVFPNQPIEPYLLYFYFLSLDMKKLGSGSSIRQINNYDIEPLVFSYPTNSEMQKTLINKLKGCKNNKDNLISNYESKKLQLNALKQSILQQAFNGELVKE